MKGPETEKSDFYRLTNGFYQKYMVGQGLDIGFKGSIADAEPVLPTAIGIDLGYPNYDGIKLPFDDCSQDYVFSSHSLEHIDNWLTTIREWYRVTKVGGYVVIIVPHKYLYEKKLSKPSRFNEDHKRLYTPSILLLEIELALKPNSYRIVHMIDNDRDFDYTIPPEKHSSGCYEIEVVIQKIDKPSWDVL